MKQILSLAAGAAFFVALLPALVVAQVGNSLLRPDFFASQLEQNNVYEFVLTDLTTAVLEDRREVEEESGNDFADTPRLTSGLATDRIVAGINRIVPPDWLREVVERNLGELGNYATGRSDDFTLLINTDDRADVALAELGALLDESDAYEIIYKRVLLPHIEDAADAWTRKETLFAAEVTGQRIGSAARTVLPPEWVRLQGRSILDQVVPYLNGASDEFTVRVELSDRVEIAADELKRILAESSSYDLLYDEFIEPEIAGHLGDTIVGLPFGVVVSSDEVVAVLRETAPPSWVRVQAERLIDESVPYVVGRTDSFAVVVSLVDNKRVAHEGLARLVESKVQNEIDRLPACPAVDQGRPATGSGVRIAPTCIPPNVVPGRILEELGIDIGTEVTRLILGPIPNTFTFTNEQLRDALVAAGAVDDVERLDEARSLLRDGWTMADIDRWRGVLMAAGKYLWLVYLLAFLLLVGVGLLEGRDWPGRVRWGAATLMVCALAIAAVSGLVYPIVASDVLDNARVRAFEKIDPAQEYDETPRLMAAKGFDLIESMSNEVVAKVTTSSLVLGFVAAVVLAVSANRPRVVGLVRGLRHSRSGDRQDVRLPPIPHT